MRKGARGRSLKPCVRFAKKGDLAALIELENLCLKEEKFNKKQLRYLLLKAKSLVLVAVLENKIIGSIIILLRSSIFNARIYSLNVHPDYRRAGIGSQLMDSAEKFAKEKDFRTITLEVGTNNKAAQNLYKKKGFFVDRIIRKYYKNGKDAFHLTKIL